VLRHDSAIGLGNLGPTIEAHGYEIVTVDAPHTDVAALDPLAPDLVVVLAGDEAAYETDRYPYLADEIHEDWLREWGDELPEYGLSREQLRQERTSYGPRAQAASAALLGEYLVGLEARTAARAS